MKVTYNTVIVVIDVSHNIDHVIMLYSDIE